MRHVVRKYGTVEQEIEASEVCGLPHEWGATASAELSERPVLSVGVRNTASPDNCVAFTIVGFRLPRT